MKARSVLPVLTGLFAAVVWLLLLGPASTATGGSSGPAHTSFLISGVQTSGIPAGSTTAQAPSNFPGGLGKAAERLRKLEQLGRVPDDADLWDWWLAQKTSWWGKRLDPNAFWKGRVVWLDPSASLAAQRRGRFYPPIPFEEPRLASRSDVDRTSLPAADTPDIPYRYNDRENAFWSSFGKTHPRPPEYIDTLQLQLAKQVRGTGYDLEHGQGSQTMAQPRLERINRSLRARFQTAGCPHEAATDQALRWALVLKDRTDYEQQFVQTHRENTALSSNFLARLTVKPNLVTQPLSGEQLKAANAWKIAYLQRLRSQKTDESYINAYLGAWNLSSADVFK